MEIPVEKNKEYIVDIIDNGFEGEGIAKIEGYTVFVKEAIKGEKARILILKTTSSHAFAKIVEIIKKSPYRTNLDCSSYRRCGGCNIRHIDYKNTLNLKREIVQNLVNKTLQDKIKVENTVGMENPYNYRNKAQYPIGKNKEGKAIVGVFANRTHEIIEFEECKIQTKISQEIAKTIIQYINENKISVYDEKTRKGIFRHLIVKYGMKTNEVMCIFVINGDKFKGEEKLVESLKSKFPNIKTIVKNINKKNTNVILGEKNIVLYGNGYIQDKLGEYTFNISAMSFYQINPVQTEKLYNLAIEGAELNQKEIVFDLYCGIGTIGIFASKYVKKVYGIEIVKEAIEDAKENARINGIDNIEFTAGDVEKNLQELIYDKKIEPDVVFVDPPRKGLDVNTVNNLLKIKPQKIVYVSCNPATLVRDLQMLENIYDIKKITPVDLFPFTSHVECVTVLSLKNSIQ